MICLVLLTLLSAASAAAPGFISDFSPVDVSLASSSLKTLLANSRRLAQDDDAERNMNFLAKYSMQFQGCHTVPKIAAAEEGQNDEQEAGTYYQQQLVKFRLCPTGTYCQTGEYCSHGGVYVTRMQEFVMAYTEARLEYQEQLCEQVQENCVCNDDVDDEVCAYQCFTSAGMDYCIKDEDEEFQIEDYLECAQLEVRNNNNNGNNNGDGNYYAGPYCSSDGNSIYLGIYEEETCTRLADSTTHNALSVLGYNLPYSESSGTSLVENDCVTCLEQDDRDDDGGDDNVAELCEEMYMQSARCEEDMYDNKYPDTSGCEYIYDILPRIETTSYVSKMLNSNRGAARGFAWVFFATTICLACLVFKVYERETFKPDMSSYVS